MGGKLVHCASASFFVILEVGIARFCNATSLDLKRFAGRCMMDYKKLSKTAAYALRHAPWKYGLEMDEDGWVPVSQLLNGLRSSPVWAGLNEDDLRKMIEASDKKRFEMKDGKIRALYGHSVPVKIRKEAKIPPNVLFHGTARRYLPSIREKGLIPKSRQYVHLSTDIETAQSVGLRHDRKPVILVIDAKRAAKDGVKFYLGNEKVWLADHIPSRYISEL